MHIFYSVFQQTLTCILSGKQNDTSDLIQTLDNRLRNAVSHPAIMYQSE